MKLLLDTHVLIWWLRDDPKLRSRARALIADEKVAVLFSAVSCWEASIKYRTGKFDMAGSEIWQRAVGDGFTFLGIEARHVKELEGLIAGHGDPFDHMLVAQARAEDAAIMTADRKMTGNDVRCIGAR